MIVTTLMVFVMGLNGGYSKVNTTSTARPGPTIRVCGIDKLPSKKIREGSADIHGYPWLGLLIYPRGQLRFSTTMVVLISRHLAIASALDIDNCPKDDFRARSRLIFGQHCSGTYIRVLDYSFHPDYARSTYSSMAIVQLDLKTLGKRILYPICPPPMVLDSSEEVYAMTLTYDCNNRSMVEVYKMDYVNSVQCRQFYRRANLDMESMWPTHMVCAKSRRGGHCIWRSGTALVIRDQGKWKLLGLGTYGPGCESPARFLDYGMYHGWIRRSIASIGQPSVTRIAPNQLILRRASTHIQRFGPCDKEETKLVMFTDRFNVTLEAKHGTSENSIRYNVTLLENVEYYCIEMQVWTQELLPRTPQIALRRWCIKIIPNCTEFTEDKMFYYVEITFSDPSTFNIVAYGREIINMNAKQRLLYSNLNESYPRIHITSFNSQ